MSIISFHKASLTLAGKKLLDNCNITIQSKDKIALVGRNGAGKSSLLKLIADKLTVDAGQIQRLNGLTVGCLMQEVPEVGSEIVYYFLVKNLGTIGDVLFNYQRLAHDGLSMEFSSYQQKMDDLQLWQWLPKIESIAKQLKIDLQADTKNLSGGMKRRVLLAVALVTEPDLLLLDEPTNHLDILAIEWLEKYLQTYTKSFVVITHDRKFLANIATSILEIDRGKLYRYNGDYDTYLDRREAVRLQEAKTNALFDKELAAEEAWIRKGIKARRTRNEGRVRALKAMREQYKARRNAVSTMESLNIEVQQSGKIVIKAEQLSYDIEDKTIVRDFSLLLARGDKVGIIGPNGCGKTTLVKLLLGQLKASKGHLNLGTNLVISYFDQLRNQLDDTKTVRYNVADGADYLTVNGKNKHVASYLSDFLFDSSQFNQQISCLSGGEKNRLLLAKILARPANLLILDEPTNDLDVESLELLENLLLEYPGTLLLISHDRALVDAVVSSILVYQAPGIFKEYIGSYEEYQQQSKVLPSLTKSIKKDIPNFELDKELKKLWRQIEATEASVQTIHQQMAIPEFYNQVPEVIKSVTDKLSKAESSLENLYQRWQTLEGS